MTKGKTMYRMILTALFATILFPAAALAQLVVEDFNAASALVNVGSQSQLMDNLGPFWESRTLRVTGPGFEITGNGELWYVPQTPLCCASGTVIWSGSTRDLTVGGNSRFEVEVLELDGPYTVTLHLIDANNRGRSVGWYVTEAMLPGLGNKIVYFFSQFQSAYGTSVNLAAVKQARLILRPEVPGSRVVVGEVRAVAP